MPGASPVRNRLLGPLASSGGKRRVRAAQSRSVACPANTRRIQPYTDALAYKAPWNPVAYPANTRFRAKSRVRAGLTRHIPVSKIPVVGPLRCDQGDEGRYRSA